MSEFDQMNEIVGESGSQGEGCLTSVAAAGLAILTGLGLMVSPAAAADLVPRRPVGCPVPVPDTYGMGEQAAKDTLATKGLTTYVWVNKEAGVWTVVHSSPQPGTVVNRCVNPLVEIWIGA